MIKTKVNEFPMYRGKVLVRSGNTVYYGNPTDPFVAMLQVITNHDFEGVKISDKVSVQIISTDESLKMTERVIKRTEKQGIYNALTIASIWLDRSESEKKIG